MLGLYPPVAPYATHTLPVDEPHQLYVEEVGKPDGLPVLFIHGGPGAGCNETSRRYFDPNIYRIILFDQRGCGRSYPHVELNNNTTQHLVADIEAIRKKLGIDKWVVFGGSWGSTLSLVYTQTYPHHVLGLILRGIFLCRDEDIDWFGSPIGAAKMFPDYYHDFTAPIKHNTENWLEDYYTLLTSNNEMTYLSAAKAWATWEARCLTLVRSDEIIAMLSKPKIAHSLALIECHYFKNQCFLAPNQIIKNTDALQDIPGIIVQGRYDALCPVENAWSLHNAWPHSELQIIPDAGHASTEPGIIDGLVRATQTMAKKLRNK